MEEKKLSRKELRQQKEALSQTAKDFLINEEIPFTKKDVLNLQKELERQAKEKNRQKKFELNKKTTDKNNSRVVQQEKSRERNHVLNVAILIVVILLAVVAYLVFNW